jgi:hypothetical protein
MKFYYTRRHTRRRHYATDALPKGIGIPGTKESTQHTELEFLKSLWGLGTEEE